MRCKRNGYYKAMEFKYPLNFMKRLFGDNFDQPMPSDINKSIEYMLNLDIITNGLKETRQRYKDLLKYRYKKNMSLQDVADEFGLCTEAIRLIDNRLLATIRELYNQKNSVVNELLTMGLDQYLKQRENTLITNWHISELKINRKTYNALMKAKKTTVGDIIKSGTDILCIKNISKDSMNKLENAVKLLDPEFTLNINNDNLDIDNLNIGYPKYIKNVGIKTIDELASLSNTEIFNIRGINITTFIEIIDELNRLGFERDYLVDISLIKLNKFRTNN